jgi:hypothetical protein
MRRLDPTNRDFGTVYEYFHGNISLFDCISVRNLITMYIVKVWEPRDWRWQK